MKTRLILTVISLLSAHNSMGQIFNGDFEDPARNDVLILNAGSTDLPGWVVLSGSVEHGAFDFGRGLKLNGSTPGTIQTFFNVTELTKHVIHVTWISNPDSDFAESADLLFGPANTDPTRIVTVTGDIQIFEGNRIFDRSYFVQPTELGLHQLQFSSRTAGEGGWFIDNIGVGPTTDDDPLTPIDSTHFIVVPEPSTYASVAGCALLGLGFVRRHFPRPQPG